MNYSEKTAKKEEKSEIYLLDLEKGDNTGILIVYHSYEPRKNRT